MSPKEFRTGLRHIVSFRTYQISEPKEFCTAVLRGYTPVSDIRGRIEQTTYIKMLTDDDCLRGTMSSKKGVSPAEDLTNSQSLLFNQNTSLSPSLSCLTLHHVTKSSPDRRQRICGLACPRSTAFSGFLGSQRRQK